MATPTTAISPFYGVIYYVYVIPSFEIV